MDNKICLDFLNAMKEFVEKALKNNEKEKQEEVVNEEVVAEADDVQVAPEEVNSDSIATSKGNEEKEVEETIENEKEKSEASDDEPVLQAADETEENPDLLKNVEVPEEKSDEERLFETAEQLTEIAKQIFERSKPMTKKQTAYVAKILVKSAQKIAKYSVKKQK